MMMMINQYPDFCISYSAVKQNMNKNKQEILKSINLHTVNHFMMKSAITQLTSL